MGNKNPVLFWYVLALVGLIAIASGMNELSSKRRLSGVGQIVIGIALVGIALRLLL